MSSGHRMTGACRTLGSLACASTLTCCFFLAPLAAQTTGSSGAVPIEAVREDADGDGLPDRMGDTVLVAGRAGVGSGVLRSDRLDLAIQDPTGGIFLYRREPGAPVERGDSVVARGVLGSYAGKLQVNVTEYRVVPAPARVPEPTTVEISGRRLERAEGTVITVTGRLVSLSSNAGGRLLVLQGFEDPDQRVTVFLPFERLASFDLTRFEAGDRVRVTGLAGQFDPEPPHDDLHQVYPLGPDSLETVGVAAQLWRRLAWGGAGVLVLALLLWGWTLRRQARRRQEVQQRYESLFAWNSSPVVEVGGSDEILRANAAFRELLGFDEGEGPGRPLLALTASDDRKRLEDGLRTAREGTSTSMEVALRAADGRRVETEAVTVPINVEGRIQGVFVIVQDITDRKRFEERLRKKALEDYLTGLPNRALLRDRLEHALARARREDSSVAVLYVDLDRFKMINDNAGHAVGDEVLKTVADRLRVLSRSSDTIARVGGDEFVLVLEDVAGLEEATAVARRILAALDRPVEVSNRSLHVAVSIGVTVSGGETETEELLKRADLAMYRAKQAGGSQHRVLQSELEAPTTDLLRMDHDLRRALESDELFLEYQPLVGLDDRRLLGLEALVRWRHPEQGRLPPGKFIPLAEETGLIVQLDRWVLATARDEVDRWLSQNLPGRDFLLSVNLSAMHLQGPEPLSAVAAVDPAAGDGRLRLQLEITESAFASEPDILNELRERGYLLAVDDFGTGYSSLSYVQDLEIDTLKLDRSFVARLGTDPASSAIARTVITLGQNLDVRVVAEGIETHDQLRILRTFGCSVGQGFLLGRPGRLSELRVPSMEAG